MGTPRVSWGLVGIPHVAEYLVGLGIRLLGRSFSGGQPLGHSRRRLVEEWRVGGVHVLAEQVEQSIAEPLGDVRGPVRAKAQATLRNEEELTVAGEWHVGGAVKAVQQAVVLARLTEEDNVELVKLALRHGKLVEVVLEIVTNDVHRLAQHLRGPFEDSQITQ